MDTRTNAALPGAPPIARGPLAGGGPAAPPPDDGNDAPPLDMEDGGDAVAAVVDAPAANAGAGIDLGVPLHNPTAVAAAAAPALGGDGTPADAADTRRRQRPVTPVATRYARLCDDHPTLDPNRLEDYQKHERVWCRFCNSNFSIKGGSTGNITTHNRTSNHNTAVQQWRERNPELALFTPRDGETEEAIAAREKTSKELRALCIAYITSLGVPVSVIPNLFGASSIVVAAVRSMEDAGIGFAQATATSTHAEMADTLLHARLVGLIEGTTGALICDAATLRSKKQFALLYDSSWLPAPILLDLITSEAVPYDASVAAADIRRICASYNINIAEQVTCLAGDNVWFNDSLAALLGVARAKCIPHGLNLVIKNGLALWPALEPLTVTAAGVLTLGGSSARIAELNKRGLLTTKLSVHENRFASVVEPLQYRLDNFIAIRDFYSSLQRSLPAVPAGPALPGAAPPADAQEETKRGIDAVVRAYNSTGAWANLHTANSLYRALIPLIASFSSDTLVKPETFEQLERARGVLVTANGSPDVPIFDAAHASPEGVPNTIAESPLSALRLSIKLATQASLDSWTNHIEPAIKGQARRRQYDTRLKPKPIPANFMEANFFGADPKRASLTDITTEYRAYINDWAKDEREETDPHPRTYENPARYWLSKCGIWKALAPVALWWLSYPTSSIAAERTFALMRWLCTADRACMDQSTIARTVRAAANREYTKAEMERTVAELRAMG